MDLSPLKFKKAELLTLDLKAASVEAESVALAKIFIGISKEWELSLEEQSDMIARPVNTIRDWNKNKKIPIPGKRDSNHIQLLAFIKLWQSLSALIVSKQGQISWLKEPNAAFDMKSPLQLIRENPLELQRLLAFVNRARNP